MTSRSCKQTQTLPQFTQYLAASALRLTGSSIRSLKSFHGVTLSHLHSVRLFISSFPHFHLITHIDHARLNVVINLFSRLHEGLW